MDRTQQRERAVRIRHLFEELAALNSAERSARLDEIDDASVRREVRSLLETYDDPSTDVSERLDVLRPVRARKTDPFGLVGHRIGRYDVLEHLGGGGMGVVYRARDRELGRMAALKFLSPHLSASDEAKERFVHEAKAASALDHSNIATIYEIGEADDGRLFIAMAYYDGETLKQRIGRGPLPIDEAIDYACQVADGLGKAHAADIVHRDVKPANVMITSDGVAKLVDFGLAKVMGAELTASGATLGTAAYMSPEQACGMRVDGQSDLWSLGVLLYEMVTGRRPFLGEYGEAAVYAIIHETPEPAVKLRPETPERLHRLVEDLLRKEPSARPPDARDVRRRLEAVRREVGAPAFGAGGKGTGIMLLKTRRKQGAAAAGIAVVAALAYVVLVGAPPESGSPSLAQSATTGVQGWTPRLGPRSIAVLPFTYLAAEDSSDHFSQGMTDELLIHLSKIQDLSVISRTSVMQYLGTDKTIPEIARELGVAYVLEGNVQHAGGRVRLQAQLIDARTDRHVWAEGITRPFRDVLQLQVDLAREIVRELEVTLLPEEERRLVSAPNIDSAAYALYLQARSLRLEQTVESISSAFRLARRSASIDSSFAPAWAELSVAAWIAPGWGLINSDPDDPYGTSLARRSARRALELDSANAEVQIAMGLMLEIVDADFAAAGAHLQKAVQLNPNLAEAQREYGLYLQRMGQFSVADRYLSEAVRLDPASPVAFHSWAENDLYQGSYERAIERFDESLTLQPDNVWSRSNLALIYCQQGRSDAARRALDRAVLRVNSAGLVPLSMLGRTYALCGLRERARAVGEQIRGIPTEVHFGFEAIILAALGETDEAFDMLEGSTFFHSYLKVDPAFESLRSDPRYDALLTRVGLDDESVRQTMQKLGERPM